jgi:hypothetical protein
VHDGGGRLGADGAGQLGVEQERRVGLALGTPAAGPADAGVRPAGDDHGAAHEAFGAVADAQGRGLVGAVQQPEFVGHARHLGISLW